MAFRLEHRVGVAAPPSVIWDILSDVEGWPRWNPLYPQARGRLGYGETLRLSLQLPGGEPEEITPAVTDWTPNSHLHWSSKLAGGLIKTTRYLEIEPLTETGCIFSNGEIFTGFLTRYTPGKLKGRLRKGFVDMGEALKREAEAQWTARREAGAPVPELPPGAVAEPAPPSPAKGFEPPRPLFGMGRRR